MITRECQRVLHQKSNMIARTNRQYDDRFAQSGAKIGQALNLRLPAKYVTRRGPAMVTQNSTERSVTLPIVSMYGVDLSFSTYELTFNINDFSKQFIEPAMAQLAATIEGDFLAQMMVSVANFSGQTTTTATYREFQNAGRYLTDNLAPPDNMRTMGLDPQTRVDFSDAVKGLFQSASNIEEQYTEGVVGRTGGFNVYENTLLPTQTTPSTMAGTPVTNGASQGFDGTGNLYAASGSIITSGWTGSVLQLNQGDIFTVAGVFAVHPETKKSLGYLKRFVVLAPVTSASGAATITFTPALIMNGAYQNVTNFAATGQTIVIISTAGATYGNNLAFHKDAFAFVSADLELPGDGKFEARERFENLSMRLIRKYDIASDNLPCRVDVAVGFTPIYPELACRFVHLLA